MEFKSAVICWIMAITYGVVALVLSRMRRPFPFLTGVIIPAEMITDVRAYNRANGKMWAIFSVIHVVVGVLALFSSALGFVLLGLLFVPGLIVMFHFHKRIFNRFKTPESKIFY